MKSYLELVQKDINSFSQLRDLFISLGGEKDKIKEIDMMLATAISTRDKWETYDCDDSLQLDKEAMDYYLIQSERLDKLEGGSIHVSSTNWLSRVMGKQGGI